MTREFRLSLAQMTDADLAALQRSVCEEIARRREIRERKQDREATPAADAAHQRGRG